MERRDWVLLALGTPEGHSLSPVQLQKSLFLLGKELEREIDTDFYQFVPHNYGPFSRAIYADAESLAADGLVTVERGGPYPTYRISADGVARLQNIKREASLPAQTYLARVVDWTKRLSFPALVRAIYARYPEYRVNSVFRD